MSFISFKFCYLDSTDEREDVFNGRRSIVPVNEVSQKRMIYEHNTPKNCNANNLPAHQSTPTSSSSNLNQLIISDLDQPQKDVSKFLISCVFNDISKLKKEFGHFQLFSNIDALSWFTKVSYISFWKFFRSSFSNF